MTTTLAKYEAARAALAAAHRVDEVKNIRDKAQAMAAYARQAKDTAMVEWATEIKVRAETRAGEMLREAEKHEGGRPANNQSHDATGLPPTLEAIGITRSQSSRWQKLAEIPEDIREAAIEECKASKGEVTSAHMLRLADELRETRNLEEALAEARKNLRPRSRAMNAWMPITFALGRLHKCIREAGTLPSCPLDDRPELLEMWTAVSTFLSTHLETPQ